MEIETKHYSDGTSATGVAPLPDLSPEQQDVREAPMNEVERMARAIAAEKMMLIIDPMGLRLSDDLWRQAIPQALTELEAQHGPEERPDWSQIRAS